jgi:uncharacterized protein YjbI with pentapeptide repeats
MSRRGRERAIASAVRARGDQLPSSRHAAEPFDPPDGAGVAAWVGYVTALFFIGIAVFGVSHRDLLLEAPVKLPLLGAAIPLRAFFVLAPILFLGIHAFVLVRSALASTRGGPGVVPRGGAIGALSRGLAFCALAVAPVLLLLLVLIQFLPFHDQAITWLQRFGILADVILIWLLWPAIVERRQTLERPDPKPHRGLLIAGLVPIGLAFTAATFPGEWLDDLIGRRQWIPIGRTAGADGQGETGWTSVHDLVFHGEIDEVGRGRKSLFSNSLVLSGFDAPAAAGLADQKALETARTSLTLRGRHLEGAVLIGADFRKVDLTGAYLDEARLDRADLQGAFLDDAWLRRATLVEASLRGALMKLARLQEARLDRAELQGAALVSAQLQGATLREAQLQDSALTSAQLQGASLAGARLEGATLTDAQLQGAKLDSAELQDATLDHAQMQGASVESARLQGASLLGAQLQGASLARTELYGTMLLGANLSGASLAHAALQGAVLRDAVLTGASLEHAQAQGTVLDYALLQGASLRGAQLEGASLRGAALIGTSLAEANVWRTRFDGATIQAVDVDGVVDAPPARRAVQSSSLSVPPDSSEESVKAAYAALKALIVHEMPKPQKRKDVMSRIEVLDPETLVPDGRAVQALDLGRVDIASYQKVTADALVRLVCSGNEFDRDVLRGLVRTNRIVAAGPFAAEIVENVLASDCPLHATLSEADKEALATMANRGAGATVSDLAPTAEPSSATATR